MLDAHRGLGEVLFAIYLIVLLITFALTRRGRRVPTALVGISHLLLAVQVVLGIILIAQGYDDAVPRYHPLLGILALLSLGLAPILRQRLGRANGVITTLGIVAVLALAAMLSAVQG